MNEGQRRPAGEFSAWLSALLDAVRNGTNSDTPCDGCVACCSSSQFVHIGPDETDALDHIPAEVLFAAPGTPDGFVLMGYDEHGRCPMLADTRVHDLRAPAADLSHVRLQGVPGRRSRSGRGQGARRRAGGGVGVRPSRRARPGRARGGPGGRGVPRASPRRLPAWCSPAGADPGRAPRVRGPHGLRRHPGSRAGSRPRRDPIPPLSRSESWDLRRGGGRGRRRRWLGGRSRRGHPGR